jgi:hypothetical protein
LDLAAQKGEKGFSRLVQEAVELFLQREASRASGIERALALAGSLKEKEADALEQSVRDIRRTWR